MKNTLKIGKTIYKMLSASTDITTAVGGKIYPLIAPDLSSVTFPFIVYSRTGIQATYCKDGNVEDRVTVQVAIVDREYFKCADIAEYVRNALERTFYRDNANNIEITDSRLTSATEYFQDDVYTQTLTFQMAIDNIE